MTGCPTEFCSCQRSVFLPGLVGDQQLCAGGRLLLLYKEHGDV